MPLKYKEKAVSVKTCGFSLSAISIDLKKIEKSNHYQEVSPLPRGIRRPIDAPQRENFGS
jgi:hypothetical protein